MTTRKITTIYGLVMSSGGFKDFLCSALPGKMIQLVIFEYFR